jgi:hypothetical protein
MGRRLAERYRPSFPSSLDKLTRSRKGIPKQLVNLGTGAHISDVDMERQKEIMGRNVIEDVLHGTQGVQTFSKSAVKPENIQLLTPDQIAMLRLEKGLEQRGAQLAKGRKIAVRQAGG